MKIDQLPVETLMQVFTYLPRHSEVSLVNKVFYTIASEVNHSDIFLRLDRKSCESILCNHAMNRKISKLGINVAEADDFVISVIKKFSTTITCLTLTFTKICESDLLAILSKTPNVEHLQLHALVSSAADQSSEGQLCNDELNLKKLKSMTILKDVHKYVEVLNRLPVGVLRELQIHCHLNTLATTVHRQYNIKKLVLYAMGRKGDAEESDRDAAVSVAEVFDQLKLDSLKLHLSSLSSATAASILSKQPKLKSLILTQPDDRIMDVVATILELEELVINISEISVSSFMKIRQLKKLQNLTLLCYSLECPYTALFKTLAESDNTSIKKLTFKWMVPMSDLDLLKSLAKSAPYLNHIDLSWFALSDCYEATMRHFNFVETLKVWMEGELFFDSRDYFNPKLKELLINVGCQQRFYEPNYLPKLGAAYPNLKKFTMNMNFFLENTPMEITPILNEFTKLESLSLKVCETPSDEEDETTFFLVSDLELLQNRKDNLKFVSFEGLDPLTLTDQLLTKLRENFDVVKVDNVGCLKMSVDRYTMKCECSPVKKHLFS